MPRQFSESDQRRTRAALFVDFDNVYLGLQTLDAAAAERFATDPRGWTESISNGDGQGSHRRFLVRNCYLNPSTFSKYRAYWTRAGFRVIDCPSLTQQGKSSTDINLVLDAVDLLSGSAKVEEFFLASADADFTSLIQRFRAADRLTTVIVAGAVASAYREMADNVVESDDFVAILGGTTANPSIPDAGALRSRESTSARPSTMSNGKPVAKSDRLAAQTVVPANAAVLSLVQTATGPVTGATVAHRARTVEPAIATDWGGYGSFGAWVGQFSDQIGYASTPSPGWAWDRTRFSKADLPSEATASPVIEQQVARVTGVPALSTAQFRQVFNALESRLRKHPFNMSETSKQVRDDCVTAEVPVSRSAINFIIQSLQYAGTPLNTAVSAEELATGWTKYVEALCRGARMEFDYAERGDLRMWLSGGFLMKSEEPTHRISRVKAGPN